MPYLRDYHILISHSFHYSNHYERIVEWLNDQSYFRWSNYSVSGDNPLDVSSNYELKQRLRDRIRCASCIIVVSGMYAAYSEWIDFEIDCAIEYGKPIIGVKPWGQERVPEIIQRYADILVGWNRDSIVESIRNYAL